ncbi:MAG: hypothetical protein IJW99_10750 [Clostridia bacterium]|nr:hypothetical protein [Clostridia bacterium]
MRRGVYLAVDGYELSGAFTDPLTEASLAWFERANFVRVRDRRDPAASAAMARAARNGVI